LVLVALLLDTVLNRQMELTLCSVQLHQLVAEKEQVIKLLVMVVQEEALVKIKREEQVQQIKDLTAALQVIQAIHL
jgi:uncharacterized membrane protein